MSYLALTFWILALTYFGTAWFIIAKHYRRSRRKTNPSILSHQAPTFFAEVGREYSFDLTIKAPLSHRQWSAQPTDLVILIDRSGSMGGNPLIQAIRGAREFINHCAIGAERVHVGLAVFDIQAIILQDLSYDAKALDAVLKKISDSDEGTAIAEGLKAASEALNRSTRAEHETVRKVIVLLTDGQDEDPECEALAKELRHSGVQIFCLGFGNVNRQLLMNIAGGTPKDRENEKAQSEGPVVNAFFCDNENQIGELFSKLGDLTLPSACTSLKLKLPLDSKKYDFVRTESDTQEDGFDPPSWYLSRIDSSGSSVVRYSLRPRCFVGFAPLSLQPTTLHYKGEDPELGEQHTMEPQPPELLLMPWAPVKLWSLLIHPLLWPVLNRFACRCQPQPASSAHPLEMPRFQQAALPALDRRAQQLWRPTLVIALGGEGIRTALALEAYLADLSDGIHPPAELRTLYIDTQNHQWKPPRFGPAQFDPRQSIDIGADLLSSHQEFAREPQLVPWYDAQQLSQLAPECFDTRAGTRFNRPLGRLALHHFLQFRPGEIEGKFQQALTWLQQAEQASGHPALILFATSTAGGSGSAIFFDLVQLMRSQIETLNLPSKALSALLIEPSIGFTVRDRSTEAILEANRIAFLLELERVKTATPFLAQPLDYPGAKPLKQRHFTLHEYVFNSSGDGMPAHRNAAAWAAGLSSGQSSEQHALLGRIAPLADSGPTTPVRVAIAYLPIPLTLIRRYAELRLALQFLDLEFGLDTNVQPIQCREVSPQLFQQQLETLFTARTQLGTSQLTTPLPLFFPYLHALAQPGLGQSQLSALSLAALKLCPESKRDSFHDDQAFKTTTRLLEWSLKLLNGPADARLALLLAALQAADQLIANALQQFRTRQIAKFTPMEMTYFEVQRLDAFADFATTARKLIQSLSRQAQARVFALGEGFPEKWPGLGKHDGIGLARLLNRRLQLVRETFDDYGLELAPHWRAEAERLAANWLKRDGTETASWKGGAIWTCEKSDLAAIYRDQPHAPFQTHPFTLQIGAGSMPSGQAEIQDSKTSNNSSKTPETGRDKLEASLMSRIRHLGFAIPYEAIPAGEWNPPETQHSETQQLELPSRTAHSDTPEAAESANPLFARSDVRWQAALGWSHSFRQSSLFFGKTESDAYQRGKRRHVLLPDARAAAIQRHLALGGAAAHIPPHPLLTTLLEEPHRLQRFLYHLLGGEVRLANRPDSAQSALALCAQADLAKPSRLDPYYLLLSAQSPISADEYLQAALCYVIERKCLLMQREISLAENWRPSPTDLANLRQAANLEPFAFQPFAHLIALLNSGDGYLEANQFLRKTTQETR